jgi:hypothetical protein
MTTEIEVTTEKNMTHDDVIKFANIGDRFQLAGGSGADIVTSRSFKTDIDFYPYTAPSAAYITLELERPDSSTYELESSLMDTIITLAPMSRDEIITSPQNTYMVDWKWFQGDWTNGGPVKYEIIYNQLSGDAPSHSEHKIDNKPDIPRISLSDSIKIATPGVEDRYSGSTPYKWVKSRKFISHKNDGSEWEIESTIGDSIITTDIEQRLNILPYARFGDVVLISDIIYKVLYKTFTKSPSSHLYSMSLGLQLI